MGMSMSLSKASADLFGKDACAFGWRVVSVLALGVGGRELLQEEGRGELSKTAGSR